MNKVIENDEQYEKSRKWMIETSIELEDPLFEGPERDKLMKVYDHVTELVLAYQRGERIKKFPGLRNQYQQLGWKFNDPGPVSESEKIEVPDTLPAPDPELESVQQEAPKVQDEPQKQVNLSDWLD